MATQTLANFDALLKDVYRGPAQEMLNQETYLIDQLDRRSPQDMGGTLMNDPFRSGGRRLIFPVHSGRNRGRGSITDGGTLPVAGKQSFLDGIVSMRYHTQAIELTDMVTKHAAGDNEGSFASALTTEIEGAVTDLRKDINRQAYGTGDGVLANCTASQTSATISVDSTQYIAVGDTVDVLTKSNGTVKGSGLTVTAVATTGTAGSSTQGNGTITLSSSVTVTNADSVYVSGNRNNEMDGLRNAIGTTGRTLHSINSSTAGNGFWDPIVKSPTPTFGNISEDIAIQLLQGIRQGGNGPADVIVTTLGVFRRLAASYVSQKRYNDAQSTKITGGWSAINVAAGADPTPVVADVDAPIGWAFALQKRSIAWAELSTPDWLKAPDGTGSTLHLKDGATAGTKVAAWQAWYGWYATLVFTAPNRNGALSQLADDNPVPRL